jgi:hypothetical protein
MSPQVASRFGVAGSTLAVLALAACGYAFSLPYRLSPPQMALLGVATVVQFAGSFFSIALGAVALQGDSRGRRFGCAAIALGFIALLLAAFTGQPHSSSRW